MRGVVHWLRSGPAVLVPGIALPVVLLSVLVALETKPFVRSTFATQMPTSSDPALPQSRSLRRRINFVFARERRTPNPAGWEAYDGAIYEAERGYGWLADLRENGRDRGADAAIELTDGTKTSARTLGRLELANWQGTHRENRPLVFRLDLPDGWYRLTCTSVDPGIRLPLVDERSFKCRAHDVVFAGANYGAPLVVRGDQLIEGTGVVEVSEGHVRLVVGDPAYGGWTWTYRGPWYRGWTRWWGFEHRYASGWYQKLTRTVDPGFHSLRLNALDIERVVAPAQQSHLVFRDFFNRDDSLDVNAGIAVAEQWVKVKLHPRLPDHIRAELYKTSMKLTSPQQGPGVVGFLQQKLGPEGGIIRYSTRVSLFTGAGSQRHSGAQEAGIVMLAEPSGPTEFKATFVGVAFDGSRSGTRGWLRYRVGDGQEGYRTNLEVPDTALPIEIREGEFEIIVEHEVATNVLRRMMVNGIDVTDHWPLEARRQRSSRGLFGIRSAIDNLSSRVRLQQFYWHYRVEMM